MTQFARVISATSVIDGAVGRPDPEGFAGTPDLRPFPHDGFVYFPWQGVLIFSDAPTPTCAFEWVDAGPTWVDYGAMPAQRAHKAAAISSCCADAILAGFVSSALGEPHTYPAKPNDQANLTGSVVRSMYPNVGPTWRTPFWCADGTAAWEFRPHTAAQIQQVGDDAVAARLNCMGVNEQLQAQIIAAETPADLVGITWPE